VAEPMVEIEAYARIHIGLLCMHSGGYRKNGGLGFALSSPTFRVTCTKANDRRLVDISIHPRAHQELQRISDAIERLLAHADASLYGYRIDVLSSIRAHSGLGSGTALTLACCEAVNDCYGLNIPISELVTLSGRGGTSGVGIDTYFNGGLVFDLGRPADGTAFVSSEHLSNGHKTPLLLARQIMPKWGVGICIPMNVIPISLEEENAFFNETCPLPADEVYETIHHALFGCLASVMEADFATFCRSINAIQESAWKRNEISLYGAYLSDLRGSILDAGARAVGMSSLGPALYFFADDIASVASACQKAHGDCKVWVSSMRNEGRSVRRA
jgi:beta-ribofuranosylaminobenzene 5'-phosphate synthase